MLLNQGGGPIDIEVNAESDFEHGLQVLEAVGECRPVDLREVTLTGGFRMRGTDRPRLGFARFVDLLERHGTVTRASGP